MLKTPYTLATGHEKPNWCWPRRFSLVTRFHSTRWYVGCWEEKAINALSSCEDWAPVMTRMTSYAADAIVAWVIGIAKCFLIGRKAHSTVENRMLILWIWLRPMTGELWALEVNLLLLILINKHSIQLPSTFISLYPQIGIAVRPRLRSFLLQRTVANAETHNWSEYRE